MISTSTTSPLRHHPTAIALVFAVLACGGKKEETVPAATTASPEATPVRRTAPPLPAPGQSGVYARRGGLVQDAGPDLNIELVATRERAQIYLYDASGEPLPANDASGKLDYDGTVATLAPSVDGTSLEAKAAFPASFLATITIEKAGKPYSTSLRWTSSGEPAAKE